MNSRHLDAAEKLYTLAQIRQIELNYAKIKKNGTYPLMEAAGQSAYQELKTIWPKANKILILTGKGNNGGDGFVIARLAAIDNKQVSLCNFCAEENIQGDALTAYQQLDINKLQSVKVSQLTLAFLEKFDLIIDAMLGTGINGAVREPILGVIRLLNQLNKAKTSVLAIDIPSGLDADNGGCFNGDCFNDVVNADVTLTFVAYKRGLYTAQSIDYRGQVKLLQLDIPEVCFLGQTSTITSENWQSCKTLLKPRKLSSHKGHSGHCLVIGGSDGMAGAAILAATAAARVGCGLTSAWLESDATSLLSVCPEVMAKNITTEQINQPINQQQEALISVKSLVVGPGLGKYLWSNTWMSYLTNNPLLANQLKIWDADALNWLAKNPSFDDNRILTPHPAEAARLLATSTDKINQERFSASLAIAKKYGGICVLKGAGTIVSDANGIQKVCDVGNPGMASGGMGDVLSGIIGSLLAQGLSLMDAATLGVCIHGEAADRVAGNSFLYRGMLASDLFKFLPELVNP